MTAAYPLQWPANTPRTPSHRITTGRFKASFTQAREGLINELDAMAARSAVLSTNVPLRLDGLPRAGQPQPDDRGVAVYFQDRSGRSMAFACDKWMLVEHNVRAISLTLEAMRGMDRWGVAEAADRVFTGFAALEAPQMHWSTVLGVEPDETEAGVQTAYRNLVRACATEDGRKPFIVAFQAFKDERGLT